MKTACAGIGAVLTVKGNQLLPFWDLWGFEEVRKLLILLVELARIELATS